MRTMCSTDNNVKDWFKIRVKFFFWMCTTENVIIESSIVGMQRREELYRITRTKEPLYECRRCHQQNNSNANVSCVTYPRQSWICIIHEFLGFGHWLGQNEHYERGLKHDRIWKFRRNFGQEFSPSSNIRFVYKLYTYNFYWQILFQQSSLVLVLLHLSLHSVKPVYSKCTHFWNK